MIDIATTISDFAGLADRFDLNGHSLRDGHKKAFDRDRPHFCVVKLHAGQSADEAWYDPDTISVYSGDFKLIPARSKLRLYDTQIESQDLTALPRQEITAFAEYLQGLSGDYLSMESRARVSEVSQDVVELLQGLGYVQQIGAG